MVRNAGKYGKAKRGGGRHFTSVRELTGKRDADQGGMWRDPAEGSDDEDESEEESSEEESSEEEEESEEEVAPGRMNASLPPAVANPGPSADRPTPAQSAISRQERKAQKAASKKKGVAFDEGSEEEEEPAAVLDNRGANKTVKISEMSKAAPEMTRREREAADKKAAAERYQKMHAAGKTDEAKADLARLAKIRKEREEAAKRKEAEKLEREKAAATTQNVLKKKK